ncbi:hypothetical protein [Nocardioides sp. Root151]|uniref:hypothetical protein n=1 Tax=Nocardioides sp. Root151 TaxID=1736475 RepID=UPI0007038288|nr:hypothetical protein [Nocardioides sp. Root151]KQZ67352.1 hypothetical protein ASD66_20580 [Nocardioides sp. Root151]
MNPWDQPLRQPNQQTCGAAVLVVARMLNDPAYRDRVATVDDFRDETLAMHRRTTSGVDVLGRLQLPWPRALGTPPWAVANQMTGSSGAQGATYAPHLVTPWRRTDALEQITSAADAGHVVPLFVGSRWLPRHVVLVLDADLTVYDPARGVRDRIEPDRFVEGDVSVSGWSRPWFTVLPD